MEFKYIVIIICLAFLGFLLFKEYQRPDKRRLMLRIPATIISVSCFVLLIIPVRYQINLQKNTNNEIILLTDGTNPDSIIKIKGPKYRLVNTDVKSNATTTIADLRYFLRSNPHIRKLNIYGYGLSEEELRNLRDYQISFHPPSSLSGVIYANWQGRLKTTEPLHLQGTYRNTDNKPVKLFLKGLGNLVDSTQIPAQSSRSFSFKHRPKLLGKAVYELIALDGNDTISKNPVPFEILNHTPVKILILASFPDFEYKFLKNWLYENQYPIAFRSQISKNKYSSDFLNTDSLNLSRINPHLLKKFDILIIDEEELGGISPEERTSIDNAINNGMGLLIRVSGPKALTPQSAEFGRFESPQYKNNELQAVLSEGNYRLNKLPAGQTLYLKSNQNDVQLVNDANGKILVNSTIKGYGKILLSSISSTYNWLLTGQKADYTTFWSKLLAKAARQRNELQVVRVLPQFPSVHQKISIITELTETAGIPVIQIEGTKLSPRQNAELPFQWDAFYWPLHTGWNNLTVNQTAKPLFIYKKTDWLSLKNQQTINSMHEFIKNTKNTDRKTSTSDTIGYEEVSIWWFFAGFLLAMAFLWYESRILQTN